MKAPKIRKHWDRLEVKTEIEGTSKTDQSQKQVVDVNAIIRRYDRTGQLPVPREGASYGDTTLFAGSLQERLIRAENTIATAKEFMKQWSPPEQTANAIQEPPMSEETGE